MKKLTKERFDAAMEQASKAVDTWPDWKLDTLSLSMRNNRRLKGEVLPHPSALVVSLAAAQSEIAELRTQLDAAQKETPAPKSKGTGSHFSDKEIAGRVRMLMRNDLDHEAVCVMARDRILELSAQVAAQIEAKRPCICGGEAQRDSDKTVTVPEHFMHHKHCVCVKCATE